MRGKTLFLSCFGCISPTKVDVTKEKQESTKIGSSASEALFHDNGERPLFEISAQHSETSQGAPPMRSSADGASIDLEDSVISQHPSTAVQEVYTGGTPSDSRGLSLSLEERAESESPFNALSLSEERRRVALQESYLRNLKSGDLVTRTVMTASRDSTDDRDQEASQTVVCNTRDVGLACHPVLFNASSLLTLTFSAESSLTDDGDLHLSDME